MMIFRRAFLSDLDSIYDLAMHSGIGITTLVKDRELLKKRIEWSCASFEKEVKKPLNEYYFFVLEDPETKKVVGTSAIEGATGFDSPFYSYKISRRTRFCHSLNIRSDYEVLSLVNDNQGKSEVCTLFLDPAYRRNSNGLLLSRARFLFIAAFPLRFSSTIIAEMRGISDEAGHSPFWDHVGSHFFHMTFSEADRLTISTDKQFIADLMPRNPIYVKLLAAAAQSVIGQPHQSTLPAMNILMHEGFRFLGYVDIFDAGPTLEAPVEEINTIKTSQLRTIGSISDEVSSKSYMVANTSSDFRATLSQAIITKSDSCIVSKETAERLKLKKGDAVRLSPLHPEKHLHEGHR